MAMTQPITETLTQAPGRRRRRQDERTFQLLFLVSFPVFLAVTLGTRVLPGARHHDDSGTHRNSLLADAAAAARSTIAIALND
jgi:hypothetical protein